MLTENKIKTKTDTTIALALPRRRGRAAVGLRVHRRESVARRDEIRQHHALQIRLVDMRCHQPVVDACPGNILSFGRTSSRDFRLGADIPIHFDTASH